MTFGGWPPTPPPSPPGELPTTGDPVDVASAAPPVAGQVLTATDPLHAIWRVPGLHYDPAIRFNVDALGEATIEPNTWGFVQTAPALSVGVSVLVVSSLAAPPIDSRFGLYVSPSLAVPVTVSLLGASQIMGLDGSLGTSVVLLPGAMYEWVFYHESGAAIWGLVSDTTRIAKSIAIAATPSAPLAFPSTAPAANQVLRATSPTVLAWASSPALSPYVKPRSSPNLAFDDEFDGGNPDLTARGWRFWNMSANAAMVRVGPIRPFNVGTAALTRLQYRSSIFGSEIVIQFPTVNPDEYQLSKTIPAVSDTVDSGACIWARGSASQSAAAVNAEHAFQSAQLAYNLSGGPDGANRVYFERLQDVPLSSFKLPVQCRRLGAMAAGVPNVGANIQSYTVNPVSDVYGVAIWANAGSPSNMVARGFEVDSTIGNVWTHSIGAVNPALRNSNVVHAGIGWWHGTILDTSNTFHMHLDYVRLYQGVMSGFWIAEP